MTEENREEIFLEIQEGVMNLLRQQLRPEFLNRVDEITVFHSLLREHMKKIIDLQIARIQKQLADKMIKIGLTDAAKNYLIDVGFEPSFGARPLRRAIQRKVIDQLAKEVLAGRVNKGDTIKVNYNGSKMTFSKIVPRKQEVLAAN